MRDGDNYFCNLCETPIGFEGAEKGVGLRVVKRDRLSKDVMVTTLEGSDFHFCNRCHEAVAEARALVPAAA